MEMLLIFAFISGLITILAPCIWPLLPVILSSTSRGGKARPLGITIGLVTSFAFFTLTLSYIVRLIPFDPNNLRLFAVFIIGFLGLTLIIPRLNELVEGFMSHIAGQLDNVGYVSGNGFGRGLVTGLSLGIVWSPCAGPILATIATLSSTRAVSTDVIIVTVVYVTGIGIPLFLFATLGNRMFTRSHFISRYTERIQQVFGVIMLLTALSIATNYDKVIQTRLLDLVPSYSSILTQFEKTAAVQNQLNILKGNAAVSPQALEQQPLQVVGSPFPDYGTAPDFAGITAWENTGPLTIKELRGKVVLVDFWTYTCINCIRTLPHLTEWYAKYQKQGFVVVGVHTPEFEFEKKTANVKDAIARFGIRYPVAQDNDYVTWNMYNNQYWPAEYLIDAKGHIRHTNFGEGEYARTETAIRQLLKEAGKPVDSAATQVPDMTPRNRLTPETYLGINRMERLDEGEVPTGGTQLFIPSKNLPVDYFSFTGPWDLQPEYARTATKGAGLSFHFQAEHAYLVLHPAHPGDTVKVFIDGKPLGQAQAGKDVKNGRVVLDTERLYDLVDFHGVSGDHFLKLEFENEGTACFAFTFG